MRFIRTSSGTRLRFRGEALPFAVLALVAALAPLGCGDTLKGRSPVILVVDNVVVQEGGVNINVLASDVVRVDPDTGVSSVFEDRATAVMRLSLKDPGIPTIPTFPTQANQVQMDRIRVVYTRTDGRNTPGVDVPHPLETAAAWTVLQVGGQGTFVLVRAQAKLEPPLLALRQGGGQIDISTIAEIQFFGHDLRGNIVSATSRMDVHFADWADPE
jgi:hypothetical protein